MYPIFFYEVPGTATLFMVHEGMYHCHTQVPGTCTLPLGTCTHATQVQTVLTRFFHLNALFSPSLNIKGKFTDARGFSKKEGVDFDKMWVARFTTIKTIMSCLFVLIDLYIRCMEKTFFNLNCVIEEEVYLNQPKGLCDTWLRHPCFHFEEFPLYRVIILNNEW